MKKINKNIILLINSLTKLSETSYSFFNKPNNDDADKIMETIDQCEDKFLIIKQEIAKKAEKVEVEVEVEVIQEIEMIKTKNGLLIKKD
jgi:hypothetical protein